MVQVPELAQHMDGFLAIRKETTWLESDNFFSVSEDLIYIILIIRVKCRYIVQYADLLPERGLYFCSSSKQIQLRVNIKLSLQNLRMYSNNKLLIDSSIKGY
jgi:hypothetical protein